MKRIVVLIAAGFLLVSLLLFRIQPGANAESGFLTNGPLPAVPVPVDNPMTDAKVSLGKQLYFDGRLSSDGTISCASCHRADAGWADKTPLSEGVGHKLGGRNSPSVINSAFIVPQFWDGRALHLEKQAVGPVQNPLEMDLTEEQLEGRLALIPGYVDQFQSVFLSRPTIDLMARAIAAFERTIVSSDSPYDRYLQGDRSALSRSAIRGMRTFNGKGHCTPCHSGPAFSDSRFHNLGIGYRDGKFADVGRYGVTKKPRDMGAFLTPRLRNVAQTPPYLHDGSEKTLMDVVDLYNRGGVKNPNLDPAMLPLQLTKQEKQDLVAFLEALTGKVPDVAPPELPNPEITANVLVTKMGGQAK